MTVPPPPSTPYLVVLGTAQDGGIPQPACTRKCCRNKRDDSSQHRRISCVGIIDPLSGQRWMIDSTPDFPQQIDHLLSCDPSSNMKSMRGIFLTHSHMGHVSGLVHLGPESLNTNSLPLYATPKLHEWIESGPPWKNLLKNSHTLRKEIIPGQTIDLTPEIRLKAICVPHRDEYAETLAFRIEGPHRCALYLPDIDSWKHLDPPIEDHVTTVDRAYLDGTFFDRNELPGRPISEVPHPTLCESMTEFDSLSREHRSRIHFLHLNHTNPVLDPQSTESRTLREAGYEIAKDGEIFTL